MHLLIKLESMLSWTFYYHRKVFMISILIASGYAITKVFYVCI